MELVEIEREKENLESEYVRGQLKVREDFERTRINESGISNLEGHLADYNEKVKVAAEKLVAYRKGVASARDHVRKILSITAAPVDETSCSRAFRVAWLYALFMESGTKLRLLGARRIKYSREEVALLRASDVAIGYLRHTLSLTEDYVGLLFKLPLEEIKKIKIHSDYRDILAAQREAARFFSAKTDTPLECASDESALIAYFAYGDSDEDTRRTLLNIAVLIYAAMKEPEKMMDCRNIDVDQFLSRFLEDKKVMGPLGSIAKKPEGFTSIANFKDSNQFHTQQEFTNQFADYIDFYSKHEGDLISTSLIVSSGLTPTQMYGNFRSFYKLKLWDILGSSEIPGGIAFVELENHDWLMISSLPDAMIVKYITSDTMQENIYLKVIKENPYRREREGNRVWFDLYDYDFNMNFRNEKLVRQSDAERWRDLRDKLLVPLIGDNAITRDGDRPLILYSLRSSVGQKTEGPLLQAARYFTHDSLRQIAEGQKGALYKPSFWQQLALVFVPFYAEIYSSQTDRMYTPNIQQLVFDSLTVFAALGSMFLSTVNLTHNVLNAVAKAVWEARKAGLAGRGLIIAAIRKLPALGVMTASESARIVAWGIYDLLEPVPLKTAFGPIISAWRKLPKVSKGFALNKVADTVLGPPRVKVDGVTSINKQWKSTGVSLNGMSEGGGLVDKNVYRRVAAGGPVSMDSPRYIEIDGGIYQVQWDEYAGSWRIMDPAHPGKFPYAVPVKLDSNNRWITHDGLPIQRAPALPAGLMNDAEALRHGDVSPLMGKGLLSGRGSSSPDFDFDFVRRDSVIDTAQLPPQKFSSAEMEKDGRLYGVLQAWRGGQVTSTSRNGPIMGVWGGDNVLDNDVRVLMVSNGPSGTVGIRIPFDQIPESAPVIVSGGQLSGCTMVYAVDENYFYTYHFGKKAEKGDWLTSRQGVASFYDAHLSLTGRTLPDLRVENDVLVNGAGVPLHGNDALLDILSTYHKGAVTYLGKNLPDGSGTRTTKLKSNVNQFDYNKYDSNSRDPRVGFAFALLTKKNGKVKAVAYSEDMSIGINKEKSRFPTLANSEYTLKDFEEPFDVRKIEPVRNIDEAEVPNGEHVDDVKTLFKLIPVYDKEISALVKHPVDRSRNVVKRLMDILGPTGRKNIKDFDTSEMPQEKVEKFEELKDFIRDPAVVVYVRAINYWEDESLAWANGRHFALILDLTNTKFVLDPTAGQLAKFEMSDPLVEVEEDWVRIYQQRFENTNTTIKYKDFASYEEALEFSPAYPVEARTFVDGAYLLREADWYRQDAPSLIDTMSTVQRGALLHFFSFDHGLSDAVAPNISLQPFEEGSATTRAFIADGSGGRALQISSLNATAGALNGMKLFDDVSMHPQFSITFWFKSSDVLPDSPVLTNKDWKIGLNPGFALSQAQDQQFKFNVGDGNIRADHVVPFTKGEWVYVAMTCDTVARTASVYVVDPTHKVQSGTLDLTGMDIEKIQGVHSTLGFNEDARGDYYSRGNGVPGTMAFNDLAMWSSALTQEQVQSLSMSGLANGLVHFFSFDAGLADAISPNLSLQPFSDASLSTARSIADNFGGKALQVVSLNRAEGALNGMKLTDDISGCPQFSIGFWFRSDGVQHHAPVLGNKDWSAGGNPGFVIDQQNTGFLKFNVGDGSKRADALIPVTSNAWVYVAMTFDTTALTATAYVGDPVHGLQAETLNLDGMDMTQIVGLYSRIGLNEDVLGNYYSRYGHNLGVMDFNDLAMWNRALTREQVQSVLASGRSLSILPGS